MQRVTWEERTSGSISGEANWKLSRSQAVDANVRWQAVGNNKQWGLGGTRQVMPRTPRGRPHCDGLTKQGSWLDVACSVTLDIK